MDEHPILFTSDMVRAILDGRKTQTRRIIRQRPKYRAYLQQKAFHIPKFGYIAATNISALSQHLKCPYGKVGDTLWVKEGFQIHASSLSLGMVCGNYLVDRSHRFKTVLSDREYRLFSDRKFPNRKTSGRFMYKSLARIFLEITNIRVERVQEIMGADCVREGCPLLHPTDRYKAADEAQEWFEKLWDSINAKRGYGWYKNPWVWVIEWKQLPK